MPGLIAGAAKRNQIKSRAQRFIVFRWLKRYMVDAGVCPTVDELTALCQLPRSTVARHMRALDGAKGLPLRVKPRLRGWLDADRVLYGEQAKRISARSDSCDVFVHFRRMGCV